MFPNFLKFSHVHAQKLPKSDMSLNLNKIEGFMKEILLSHISARNVILLLDLNYCVPKTANLITFTHCTKICVSYGQKSKSVVFCRL